MTGKWFTLLNALLLISAIFLGIDLACKITFLFYQKPLRSKVVLLVNGSKEILEADKGRQIAEISEPEPGNYNEARRTALMEAVNQGRRDNAALLLAQGEDVNARDAYGNNSFKLVIRSGRSDIVRMLIDNGADVNQKDNVGNTPLIDSARYPGRYAPNVI